MRIILCVTNDIATDQRVHRIASSLKKIPSDVLLVGLSFRNSMPLPALAGQSHRIAMLFRKGPLFYAEFNIKLFFYLLFSRADLLVANDLDTLPAVYLAARLKRKPVIYDSHEYYTELPELIGRKWTRKFWGTIEAILLPRIQYAYTVCASIAADYEKKYGINMQVIRNLPFRSENLRESLPEHDNSNKRIIYQGSLNMGRGLVLAISAMQFVENATLVIAGSGYYEKELMELTRILKLKDKVNFVGRIPPDKLLQYTSQAHLGISLEEGLGLNYYYALPNKLFDYIQARIPVLVSDLPEMASVVHGYGIGRVTKTSDPFELALIFNEMLTDEPQRKIWQANLGKASGELIWEKEENKLLAIYNQAIMASRP
jgi:glycosyltransferase involved in cell wall biosynthesis